MELAYDQNDPKSIEEYGKRLLGKTLRQALERLSVAHDFRGKGQFGQFLEEYYYGIHPGNKPEPDFLEAGVELKSFPLKKIGKGIVAKERLVLGMIDYMAVHGETWEKSSLLHKNALLMLVAFLYEEEKDFLDYVVKLAELWKFPEQDIKIIRDDWEKIITKIRDGKAHELSEGDTLYLGACTKGADSTGRREQPFSKEAAKPRAFCLKQSYVNTILGRVLLDDSEPVLKDASKIAKALSFEDLVVAKFAPFIGMTDDEIHQKLGLEISKDAKSYHATLARRMMGVEKGKVEEFVKAGIVMKTIRLEADGKPKESMSFPTFKYKEIVVETWDESTLKEMLEQRFFFVVYQRDAEEKLRLKKVMFWTIPVHDLEVEVQGVWEETIRRIQAGQADDLPGQSENPVSHVRPHAQDGDDTYETPQGQKVVKKCFWLNREYISSQVATK